MRFDLDALRDDLSTLVLVPVFLLALLGVRGLPAVVYRKHVESPRVPPGSPDSSASCNT